MRLLAALACVVALSSAARPQDPGRSIEPWPESVVALFESLPVQDGGRIKPLRTFASYTLLQFSGRRTLKTADGRRLGALEWLLDTLFFPRDASEYPLFLVQDRAAVEALGLSITGKKKRDRYSFVELRPGLSRLFELGRQYGFVEEKERSSIQQQVFLLASNVHAYTRLAGHLDFARAPLQVGAELAGIFPGARDREGATSFAQVVAHAAELRVLFEGPPGAERDAAGAILRTSSSLADVTQTLALIPPAVPIAEDEEWFSPGDLLYRAFDGKPAAAEHLSALRDFEALVRHRDDRAAFERELESVHSTLTGLARARGEVGTIGLELSYYKSKVLTWSHVLFLVGFVGVAGLWLMPKRRLPYGITWATVAAATACLCCAITMRCLIRGRPPVSTLYETVLFVTAVGSLVALASEWINRQRIALSATAALGTVGLFIASGYEMLDKRDTMPSLVAVLDTNFWLATHVTSVTMGYAAGMLAALLASGYLLAKVFRLRREDPGFYRDIARMVYGVLCFGLIFSLVGTILGGIWANDSWGRFWGWDPKENGALMIVMAQIVILHARMGGYVREHGLCMAAAFGGTIVAFSWWGVNLLGVGLHSYGFTSGVHTALWTYYAIQWGIVGLGGVRWALDRRAALAPGSAGAPSASRSAQEGPAGVAERAA